MAKKITIEPVTRVEGHGKVTIHLDDEGKIRETRLHIVEFRGFERFIQGRPYWEAPVLVQRLCGICPVSHHLAAAKAMDVIVGTGPDGLTPTAEKMRRLMHYGQIFQSHSLHFFHLASPDLLFGVEGDPNTRNIIGVALANKELAVQGVMMRKFGQEVIQATAGKKIHGTGAIPGGINKHLSVEERDHLLKGKDPVNADKMIDWSLAALEFFKSYHSQNKFFIDNFSVFPSSHLSLVRKDGALDLYHGVLRAVDANGKKILHDVDYQDYAKYISEEVRTWSYMKFPYLKAYGKEKGWYTVGPLARMNTAEFIDTPLAQKEFEAFKAYTGGKVNNMSMHMHWARLIEILHSAEMIKKLLSDPDIVRGELVRKGEKVREGVGLLEAPRGTLFHHYRINDNDQIEMANLIVSTTNNNQPMNLAVNKVARDYMEGQKEITEGMRNAVEV
ncbi:Ni/Fe hydrogenase subunit alpha, partial [bacterium]|nr:Ni/Fe hydrogenase subunit alpha [bacterium]